MNYWQQSGLADRHIIGGSTLRSITPWIVAVMSFTILLVAASGLVVAQASGALGQSIEGRYAMEVPGGGDVQAIAARVRAVPGIGAVEPVSESEMRDTLRRWLGEAADSRDLPVPALINFDLRPGADPAAVERSIERLVPDGTIGAHGASVAPLVDSLWLLQGIALTLVLLLGLATTAAVVLAARGAMDTNRPTVEVLHGIGATDAQITGLFQRRIATETLIGALGGGLVAAIVLALVAAGTWWAGEAGGIGLAPTDFLLLASLPFALTGAATLAASAAIRSILANEL